MQNDEVEQEIIDLLLNALKLCATETVSSRQIMYTVRSGLIYQNLGNVYSRAYQREKTSETRRKKLIQLCRLYYNKAEKVFENCDAPNELLEIRSDRMELQHILYQTAQNSSQKRKFLQAAISMASDSRPTLERVEKMEDPNPSEAMEALSNFESQLQLVLKNSIRHAMNNPTDRSMLDEYKKAYALTLQSINEKTDYVVFAKHLKQVLDNVKLV